MTNSDSPRELPLLIQTLRRQPVERPPVWLMRQAGRYLPEYRAIKEKHSFLEMCQTPALACEVTLQPVDILDVDAAILFADILLPLQALGIQVAFNPGPSVMNPVRTPGDVARLKLGNVSEKLAYVGEALQLVRANLSARPGQRKALLGFAGAPWTLACYLLAQEPFKHFHGTQVFAGRHPEVMRDLLQLLAEVTIEYLKMQIRSGADAVQLFDSWGGNLSVVDYQRWSLPFIEQIARALKPLNCPVMVFVGNCAHLMPIFSTLDIDALSIDWRASLPQALSLAKNKFCIQGNFDPAHLFVDRETVRERTRAMLNEVQSSGSTSYIANLGHGVLQQTPVENVKEFVDTIKGFRWTT